MHLHPYFAFELLASTPAHLVEARVPSPGWGKSVREGDLSVSFGFEPMFSPSSRAQCAFSSVSRYCCFKNRAAGEVVLDVPVIEHALFWITNCKLLWYPREH